MLGFSISRLKLTTIHNVVSNIELQYVACVLFYKRRL